MNIEIRSLDYQAGKKQILQDISVQFEGRKIYGIIGPNGCGKTTLLRHIYKKVPSHGTIYLDGKDIHQYSGRAYARRIAVMMQHQDSAEQDLTVWDVAQTGRYPYKKILTGYNREDEEIVEQVLEQVGLAKLRDRSISTLSGGELQRVILAKCLVQQPEAIILDEPTNHLDIRYKLELMNVLQSFNGLVIMTIHDLNIAARYCDHLILMKEGRIVLEGEPREVLQEQILNDVFNVHIGIRQMDGQIWVNV